MWQNKLNSNRDHTAEQTQLNSNRDHTAKQTQTMNTFFAVWSRLSLRKFFGKSIFPIKKENTFWGDFLFAEDRNHSRSRNQLEETDDEKCAIGNESV